MDLLFFQNVTFCSFRWLQVYEMSKIEVICRGGPTAPSNYFTLDKTIIIAGKALSSLFIYLFIFFIYFSEQST